MKKSTFLKKILGGVLLSVFLLNALVASALTVSPAREELTADPGESITKTFTVINEQDADQVLYTSVKAFDAQGESGTPNFIQSNEGLPSWVTIAPSVTLKKGERVAIPYTVTVPPGAEPGGHFAAIFLSTVPPSAGEGQVSVGSELGMLVLLKVTGEIKEQGGLVEFGIKGGKKVITNLPIDFFYRFKNDGNDRAKLEGKVTITNMFGGEVASIDPNPSQGNVLPGSTRKFEFHLGEGVAPAVSAPFFEHVKYQKANFAFGKYTADLSLTFGNTGKAEQAITYFMFPWQLLSVVMIVLVFVLLSLVLVVKQYNKWIIKQARAAAKQ